MSPLQRKRMAKVARKVEKVAMKVVKKMKEVETTWVEAMTKVGETRTHLDDDD
jgi:Asp-tRNA(Asn)/Glu-tRNA(Gln) amidotransferase C subunit